MAVAGRGRIVVWEGAALWILQGEHETERTGFHAHHAIQLTLAVDGRIELRAAGTSLSAPCVAVAADAEHEFIGSGITAFLFLDPEGAAGKSFAASAFAVSPLALVTAPGLDRIRDTLRQLFHVSADEAELKRVGAGIVDGLAATDDMTTEPRVLRMIDHANANLGGAVSLAGAAGAACLSESRARHLFVEETGLPFKSYILWLRIRRAVDLYARGASLTEAAHEAGFADSAHFSRTFRRTFGVAANALRVQI